MVAAFALQAAQRQLALPAAWQFELSGIGYLHHLRNWLEDSSALDAALDRIGQIWERAHSSLTAAALIGDQAEDDQLLQLHRQHWAAGDCPSASYQNFDSEPASEPEIWTTASPVQYWALAFETVPYTHPDAAALYLASQFLTNTQLHPLIREQGGAYGGGAQAQSGAGVFALTSYRDPRLLDTVQDFRLALQRGIETATEEALHEALLSSVQAVDTLGSPASEGLQRFLADLRHGGVDKQQAFRQQLIAVSREDIGRVIKQYLPANGGALAVVTGNQQAEQLADLGSHYAI